jgi:ferredoxin
MTHRIFPTATKNLREALESEGFRFPCGGKGLCGRCRILAPALAPTPLDRRFLSEEAIAGGMRLACDKTFDEPIDIEVCMEKAPKKRKLYEPLVFALLGDFITEIGILEDHALIESTILPSPQADTIRLRAIAGKSAIELYEKYGVAKASVMLVAGTAARMRAFDHGAAASEGFLTSGDTLSATKFDMPAEEVYLPPFPNAATGSIDLLELDDLEEGSFLLSVRKSYNLFYKGATTVACASLSPDTDKQNTLRAVTAGIQYFSEVFSPIRYYCIEETKSDTLSCLASLNPVLTQKESAAAERAKAALFDNRYKTRLDKLARKAAWITLAEEEKFFTLLGTNFTNTPCKAK